MDRRRPQMPTAGGYIKGPGGLPTAHIQVTPTQYRPAAVIRTPHGSAIVSPKRRPPK